MSDAHASTDLPARDQARDRPSIDKYADQKGTDPKGKGSNAPSKGNGKKGWRKRHGKGRLPARPFDLPIFEKFEGEMTGRPDTHRWRASRKSTNQKKTKRCLESCIRAHRTIRRRPKRQATAIN